MVLRQEMPGALLQESGEALSAAEIARRELEAWLPVMRLVREASAQLLRSPADEKLDKIRAEAVKEVSKGFRDLLEMLSKLESASGGDPFALVDEMFSESENG